MQCGTIWRKLQDEIKEVKDSFLEEIHEWVKEDEQK